MKKCFSLLLVLILMLGVFAACAADPPKESGTEKTESASEPGNETESHQHTPAELTDCYIDQVCTVCGEVLRPASAHTNEVTAQKQPTCTEGGYIEYTCKVCGLVTCGELAPLGHNLSGNRHTGTDGKQYVTCSRCGEEVAVTDEEAARLAKIAESILGERLRIVAYYTPDKDNPYLVEQYRLMLEAGFNTSVVNGLESSNGMWLYLDAANETGMDLLADSTSCYNNPEYVVNRLRYLDEEEHLIGLYLRDEPYPFWFGHIGETAAALREAYPESGWIMAANLLAWGNPAYAWNGVWENDTEKTTYGQTDENGLVTIREDMKVPAMHSAMKAYLETVKPDYLCFDCYPFYSGGADYPDYVGHLAFFQTYALEYDLPMWSFLQTCFDFEREQIRSETNLTLAAGAKTVICYTWEHMVNADNEIRPCYDIAKQVFNGIHAMKGVYLDYDMEKYIIVSKDERYRQEFVKRELEEVLVESYAELAGMETEGEIFVGCGKNAEGKTGLYVVNMSFEKNEAPSAVTLTLTGETAYRLWGDTEGLEAEGVTDRFLLTLEPGEGCFIELNP